MKRQTTNETEITIAQMISHMLFFSFSLLLQAMNKAAVQAVRYCKYNFQ